MRFTQEQMEILVRCLHQNQITEAEFILLLKEPSQPKNDVFPPPGWVPYNPVPFPQPSAQEYPKPAEIWCGPSKDLNYNFTSK